MRIVEEIVVPPPDELQEEIIQQRIDVDNFPLWTKLDSPDAIQEYVNDLKEQGVKVDFEDFFNSLPDCPPDLSRPSRKRHQEPDSDDERKSKKKKAKKVKTETKAAKLQSTQSRVPRITRSSAKETSKSQVDVSSAPVINVNVIPSSSSSSQTLTPFPAPLIPKYQSLTTPLTSTSAISTSAIVITTTQEHHTPPPIQPDLLDQIRQASSAPTPPVVHLPFPNHPELPQPSSPKNTSSTEREFHKVMKERTSGPLDEIFDPIPPSSSLFNPTPLAVVFPPFSSPDSSQISLSNYSPVISKDFVLSNSDPQPIPDQTTSDQVTQFLPPTSEAETSAQETTSSNQVVAQPKQLPILPYTYPDPTNLMECINIFNGKATTQLRNLYAITSLSEKPNMVNAQWESFVSWMQRQIEDMHAFTHHERSARVEAAKVTKRTLTERRQVLRESKIFIKLREAIQNTKNKEEHSEEAKAKRAEAEAREAELEQLVAEADELARAAGARLKAAKVEAAQKEAARLDALETSC
ncbi:flocculation protein FLO11-like [Lotus japonicus]|uniref:flocculation protein FLO11-like n=1 Tax=Lotus japonicus TaxID=34305 RepID=UPI0025840D60|nr:flocculation protein FLO11-like [Lotus japonicus]